MAYNYGKIFKKDGKKVRYRYTNKKKSTKKLVSVGRLHVTSNKKSRR